MTLQMSEIIAIAIGLTVLPALIMMGRKTRDPGGRRGLVVGYTSVLAANTLTIAEGVGGTLGAWLNLAEHAALLVAGVAFLWSVTATRRALCARAAGQR